MTLKLSGLWRLCIKYKASLAWTLSPIAVSAIFTGRLWPPAQRRPVKHAKTEKGRGVQPSGARYSVQKRQRPLNFLEGAETRAASSRHQMLMSKTGPRFGPHVLHTQHENSHVMYTARASMRVNTQVLHSWGATKFPSSQISRNSSGVRHAGNSRVMVEESECRGTNFY